MFKLLLSSSENKRAQNIKPGPLEESASLLMVMPDKCHPLRRLFNSSLKIKNDKYSAVFPKTVPVYRVYILTAVLKTVT